jgi:hypothetical protein
MVDEFVSDHRMGYLLDAHPAFASGHNTVVCFSSEMIHKLVTSKLGSLTQTLTGYVEFPAPKAGILHRSRQVAAI